MTRHRADRVRVHVGQSRRGPGFDEEVAASITVSSGIPATTTATEVLAALRALDARVIASALPTSTGSPSPRSCFEAAGFRVGATASLGLEDRPRDGGLDRARSATWRVALTTPRPTRSSCRARTSPTLGIIASLEQGLGKPVVSLQPRHHSRHAGRRSAARRPRDALRPRDTAGVSIEGLRPEQAAGPPTTSGTTAS